MFPWIKPNHAVMVLAGAPCSLGIAVHRGPGVGMRDGPCLLPPPRSVLGPKPLWSLHEGPLPALCVPPSGCTCGCAGWRCGCSPCRGPCIPSLPPRRPFVPRLVAPGRETTWLVPAQAGRGEVGALLVPPSPSFLWLVQQRQEGWKCQHRRASWPACGVGSWSRSCGNETWRLETSALSQAWSSNPLTQVSARFLQASLCLTQRREERGSFCTFLSPELQLGWPRARHGVAGPVGAGRVAVWQKGHLQLSRPLGALVLSLWPG